VNNGLSWDLYLYTYKPSANGAGFLPSTIEIGWMNGLLSTMPMGGTYQRKLMKGFEDTSHPPAGDIKPKFH
jgi:hypothetical protein